jgi:ABC-2 type transport system ATP-binding protein
VIEFKEVWKTYPRELGSTPHCALKGVSFSLHQGETLGLIGANGAGKSSCIRLIMDFIRPDRGEVTLFGSSPRTASVRSRLGYLPELPSFALNLTMKDMIRFTAATCGLSAEMMQERSERWLKYLDLWDVRSKPLRSFSKGMQQRANFVLALVNDPDLLILDEPMSGLDPLGRAKIISLIQALKREGKTILFCSHILEDVDRLADRLLVLHLGEKKFEGTTDDLCTYQQANSISEAFLNIVGGGDAQV